MATNLSLQQPDKGKGLEALTYLRTSFDAGEGDGSDHASHLADLHKSVIEPRSDISENDCRKQYDHMMTATAAIERTGNPKPAEATLIAMFDNSMPTHMLSSGSSLPTIQI